MSRKIILSETQFRDLLKEENLTKSDVEKIVHIFLIGSNYFF